jgi:uncharacterized protein (DUF1778 family)
MRTMKKRRTTMPGKHKNPTIAFRPSDWQRSLIEERAALSGHQKKDFIARSCIYSNIVVVGNKENIKRIVDSVQEMQYVMKEIRRATGVRRFLVVRGRIQRIKK